MADAVCRDCGYAFGFDPDFYAIRQLAVPVRCHVCREKRRALKIHGRVRQFTGTSGTIIANDGREFFVDLSDFGSDSELAAAGAPVRFLPDCESWPSSPRARSVKVVDDTAYAHH